MARPGAGGFALTNENLEAVWAVSDSDVWAVGAAGTVLHFNGTSWAPEAVGSTAALRGVWVSSSGTVWVVGDAGLVLRRSGSTWSTQTVPTSAKLNAVTGAGARVWAVGESGVVLSFDGATWGVVTPQPTWALSDVLARSETDVWAVSNNGVLRYTGAAWASSTAAQGESIAASASSIWVSRQLFVESTGSVYRFDGLAWTGEALDIAPYLGFSDNYALKGVTVGPATDEPLVVGTNGTMYRRVAGTWVRSNRGVQSLIRDDRSPKQVSMTGIAAANGAVMAGGTYPRSTFENVGGVYTQRSDAGVWAATSTFRGLGRPAVRGVQSAYFGGSALLTLDAGVESSLFLPHAVDSVVTVGPSEAWAIGGSSTTRFNGSAWVTVPNPVSGTNVTLTSASATGTGNEVWVGGTGGTILRYAGSAWQAVPSPTTGTIQVVQAQSGGRAVAAGPFGVIRWNGSAWVTTARTTAVTSVWPETTTTWWSASGRELLFWNGTQFVNQAPWAATSTSLTFVDFASDGSSLWVLGRYGEVLRR